MCHHIPISNQVKTIICIHGQRKTKRAIQDIIQKGEIEKSRVTGRGYEKLN